SGGRGQYGHVVVNVEPRERGQGITVENKIVGGVIPREYIPAVKKGIEESLVIGPIAGYPVQDMRISLLDGSFHEVDSSELAFKIAGSMAVKNALKKAGPIMLEPI